MGRGAQLIAEVSTRLKKNSPRTQMLAIELVDNAVRNCRAHFYSQVGSEPFMNIIVRLATNKAVAPIVSFY